MTDNRFLIFGRKRKNSRHLKAVGRVPSIGKGKKEEAKS